MDTIEFHVEEDGTVSIRVGGQISPINHLSADKCIKDIEVKLAGEVHKKKIEKGLAQATQQTQATIHAGGGGNE